MRFVTLLLLFVCVSVYATPAYDALLALKNRIIDPSSQKATLNAATIGDSRIFGMLQTVTNQDIIIIDYVKWDLVPEDPPKLMVWGEAHLFGVVQVDVYFEVTAENTPTGATLTPLLKVDIAGGWDFHKAMGHLMPTGTWTSDLTWGEAKIHLEATLALIYIKATVVQAASGDVLGLRSFVGDMKSLQLTVEFNIPIHSSTPADVTIYLGVTVPLNVKSTIRAGNMYIHVVGLKNIPDSANLKFDVTALWSVTSGPVTWQVTADWTTSTKDLLFTGGLVGVWNNPIPKVTWFKEISVLNVQGHLTCGTPVYLNTLVFRGEGVIQGKTSKIIPTIVGHINDDATELSLSLSVDFDISKLARIVSGREDGVMPFDDIHRGTGQIYLDISTFVHMEDGRLVHRGVQLGAIVELTADSPLYKRLQTFFKKITGQLQTIDFTFELILPVFDQMPDGITFLLKCSDIMLTKNMKMAGLTFTLNVHGAIVDIYIATGLSVLFNRQPDWVTFMVEGGISTDGTVTIKGAMIGTLYNVFGLKGFDLSTLWIEIGFIPPTGLDRIGLGGTMTVGETTIQVGGLVPIDEPDKLFIFAELDKFSFRDIIKAWNKIDPARQIDPSKVPDVFDIYYMKFYFAPVDEEIDIGDHCLVHFRAGLLLAGNMTIMGVDNVLFELSIDLDKKPVDVCFQFDMHFKSCYDTFNRTMTAMFDTHVFHPYEVESMSSSEIDAYVTSVSSQMPQIRGVAIDRICTSQIAAGASLIVHLTIEVQGQIIVITIPIPLKALSLHLIELIEQGFIDIKKWITGLECVIDKDCSNSPKGHSCIHEKSSWHCGTCDPAHGRIPVFGCVSCITSAECVYTGSGGFCCDHGTCRTPRSGDYCGLCVFGHVCNVPESGCIFGFCTKCRSSLDCYWHGAAGKHCRDGVCAA